MSAQGQHKLTEVFELEIARYTGAPYCVCVDNCSNAIFLALMYNDVANMYITIPSHTYMSVACEIIHAGGKVVFHRSPEELSGAYYLHPTKVVDSALRFSGDMYIPGTYMCLSFTGEHKHLRLGKGGAILTDDPKAVKWLKKARFSGREECSYHEDNFDKDKIIGWNYWMLPELAKKGLELLKDFYNEDGTKKIMEDKILPYPDLSKFKCYQK